MPGIVSEYVEEKAGVPLLFINGAAGNIAPIYSTYPNASAAHLSQFRVMLGDKILNANRQISVTTDKVQLFTGRAIIETPRKENLAWPLDLGNYTRDIGSGRHLIKLPVSFLKINDDIAIWSLPVELFCEISNEIRDRSPYTYTFYYGYTNGWLGYLPAANEFAHGGYEVEIVCPYTPAAEQDVKDAVLSYLQGDLRAKLTADRSPVNRQALVTPDEAGVLVLSAEKGKAIGPKIKYMPEWKAFGWFQHKDKVEWEISPNAAKVYTVIMEWSVADDHSGQPFILESNAGRITGNVEKSGSWETFTTAVIGELKLKPGKQKLIFKPGKNFNPQKALLDLRKIILVPNDLK